MKEFIIVGAGLAGCECAVTLANLGFPVTLYEQKPDFKSEAHVSDNFAELVCSNSLRSNELTSAVGLLKEEMRELGSTLMKIAAQRSVPAGKALAVDRELFAADFTRLITRHPLIKVINRQICSLSELDEDGDTCKILATGPLTAQELLRDLQETTGKNCSYFYDAIAPIIWRDSIDENIVFRASRYEDGPGDYLNCPMTREEFETFYEALLKGEVWQSRKGNGEKHFEGCMPIETLAARGTGTLLFGPFKPVGLRDPKTGRRPWAVLQLRPEQLNQETCNLVGCQTKLLQKEQARIFRLVPGLQNAEFVRYGSMHRNSYINAPEVLGENLELLARPDWHVAGQLTGVEGYVESAASGLWLALALAGREMGVPLSAPPPQTALGGLLAHLRHKGGDFQPSNATFGLMPELNEKVRKQFRKERYSQRGRDYFSDWLKTLPCELRSD